MSITPLCRFTYVNVWEPKANDSGKLKYSAGLLFPKSDKAACAAIKQMVDEAVAKGVKAGKFKFV